MTKKTENILQLIYNLTGSDFVYLVDPLSKDETLSSAGKFGGKKNELSNFNTEVVKNFTGSEGDASQIDAFKKLKENGFNSGFVFSLKSKTKFLILLSSDKNAFNEEFKSKVKPALNLLQGDFEKSENINFQSVAGNAQAAFFLTDVKGNKIFANKYFYELFGLKRIENDENPLKEITFYDEDDNEIKYENFPFFTVLENKNNIMDSKLKFISEDGKPKWLRFNSILVQDENNKPFQVINSIYDITNIKEIEKSFEETTSYIKSVLYSTNADGSSYNFVTGAAKKIFGYSPEEIYENRFLLMRTIRPDHFYRFKDFIDKLKSGEQAVAEYEVTDKSGAAHYVRHTGFPIKKDGKITRIVGAIHDITEEHSIQTKLESSEEKFRMLIETANDLIFILNGFGYFEMVNKNGALSMGYSPQEMIGKHFLEFIDKDDESKIAAAFEKIINTNDVTYFDAAFKDKFDKKVIFEIQARPMKSNGEIEGMLSIGRNITRRREDETKLRELNVKLTEANRIISIERERAKQKITVLEELNKLKNDFISNVSHELRTPLASIVGFAETLASDQDLSSEEMSEFSNIILTEGKRLANLINDILDFSKLEAGEEGLTKTEFNLIDVLKDVTDGYFKQIQEKELTLSMDLPDKELKISADRERIKKVISNLLSNSVKFTNRGGKIKVDAHDLGKEIEFTVSDNGIGIPENDLPNLFQKFSKVNRKGSQLPGAGFGLAAVKQIVDMHKGLVKVESEEQKGTTIIVRLPK